MKKRQFIAWVLMPKDKTKKLTPLDAYANIAWTEKDLISLGLFSPELKPTKVKVIEI